MLLCFLGFLGVFWDLGVFSGSGINEETVLLQDIFYTMYFLQEHFDHGSVSEISKTSPTYRLWTMIVESMTVC